MPDKMAKPEQKKTTFIQRKESYVDEHGRVVDESIVIHGAPPEDFVRFTARASVTAAFEGGTATKSFKVPLPRATNVQEAFDQIGEEYDAAMEKAAAEIKQEIAADLSKRMAQQQVMEAPRGLLDTDGKIAGATFPAHRRRRL